MRIVAVQWEGLKKCQSLTFKVNFFMSKIIWIFHILEHFFIDIFDNSNFKITLLLKWCPIFDSSPLHQFSKFNNCLWLSWAKICLMLYPHTWNSIIVIVIMEAVSRLSTIANFVSFCPNFPPMYLSALDFWHSLVELDSFPRLNWKVYFKLDFFMLQQQKCLVQTRKKSSWLQLDFF